MSTYLKNSEKVYYNYIYWNNILILLFIIVYLNKIHNYFNELDFCI